ncbi:Y-family DNA polymerase [Aliikangiella sp. IMCC44653]
MWLAITLPHLAIESCLVESGLLQDKQQPAAVIENNRILNINLAAKNAGIKVSQTVSSALALCDKVQLLPRNPSQEQQRINQLALMLYQFSSAIVLQTQGIVLIEIARSLKLYKGLNPLLNKITSCLTDENLSYKMAIGQTPKAALLLTQHSLEYSKQLWQEETQSINLVQQKAILEKQAITSLCYETHFNHNQAVKKILSVGLKSIGDLNRLPYAEINQRFGVEVTQYLQQLFGKLSDPQVYFKPAEFFDQKLDFIDVVHHKEGLSFPIKRLLKYLCRFLILKQRNAQCLHWQLTDISKNTIGFDVLISDSKVNLNTYLELTRLNLERYSLHAPVESIRLRVEKLHELNVIPDSLFSEHTQFNQSLHFINKIQAKLGKESCYQLSIKNEHVPELSYQTVSTTEYQPSANKLASNSTNQINEKSEKFKFRPNWLLETPRPIGYNQRKLLWHGELNIISSQEKITHYWWKQKVARDYYLAEHENGSLYWVFYDQIKSQWFLHGIYS